MEHTPNRTRLWIAIPGIVIVLALAWLLIIRVQARHRLAAARAAWTAEVQRLGVTVTPPADIPSSEDAASWINAACQIVSTRGYRNVLAEALLHPAASWTPDQARQIERLLAENAEAIALLHRAAQLPRLSGAALEGDPSAGSALLLGVLWAGRILAVSARAHLGRGEEAAAIDDLAAIERIASGLEQGARTLLPLVGIACEGFVEAVVHDAIGAGRLGPTGAARLAAALPDNDLVHVAQAAAVKETGSVADQIEGKPLSDLLVQGGLFSRTNPGLKPGRASLLAALGIPWRTATLAAFYRQRLEDVRTLATPYAKVVTMKPGPRPSAPIGVFIEPAGAIHFSLAAGRFQGRAAMRRLMRDALGVVAHSKRGGGFPPDLSGIDDGSTELFCACAPVYRVRPDGTAVVDLPGAAPLWARAMGKIVKSAPPLFTWEIARPRRRAGGRR